MNQAAGVADFAAPLEGVFDRVELGLPLSLEAHPVTRHDVPYA